MSFTKTGFPISKCWCNYPEGTHPAEQRVGDPHKGMFTEKPSMEIAQGVIQKPLLLSNPPSSDCLFCFFPAVRRLFSSLVKKATTFDCNLEHRLLYFTFPSPGFFLHFLEICSVAEISFCNPYFFSNFPVKSLAITRFSRLVLVLAKVVLIFAMRAW